MITTADKNDVAAIVSLVNNAYRGEVSRNGWTSEADLFDGDRIDAPSLIGMMQQEGATLFVIKENGKMTACVYLRKEEQSMYLGMLTTDPYQQGRGLGKQLMQKAEEHARYCGCRRIYMRVIETRKELIAWYGTLGYHATGERTRYEGDALSVPKQEIWFAILEKQL